VSCTETRGTLQRVRRRALERQGGVLLERRYGRLAGELLDARADQWSDAE
jgi:hypothetical protein